MDPSAKKLPPHEACMHLLYTEIYSECYQYDQQRAGYIGALLTSLGTMTIPDEERLHIAQKLQVLQNENPHLADVIQYALPAIRANG